MAGKWRLKGSALKTKIESLVTRVCDKRCPKPQSTPLNCAA
jgi:hypothetical protein